MEHGTLISLFQGVSPLALLYYIWRTTKAEIKTHSVEIKELTEAVTGLTTTVHLIVEGKLKV